ncbi:hypothetical protein NQ318_006488 [Aromia moschata]|uniref:Centrosome-associated zinc finger protein CP190 n=1 Tax=Aromia moschata TaxID=1265417 RepID=A0AAV8YM71_9CUCU|nr:hypothetical protein NQ318_006488 [Aromia moschata]
MVEGSKQLRVDNWGIFFLQRLQMFFSKTDYCDLTLQFEGNVQLKVHRLVMNACTEYFTFLEQTCPALEENTIMMPTDLQADVIVPIVNFMYTGMLEFHISIYEKLYKAAEVMNITVLTKLLDAQKIPLESYKQLKKKAEVTHAWNLQGKKVSAKTANTPELPLRCQAEKYPCGRGRTSPLSPCNTPTSQLHFSEQRWSQDPLMVPNNAPKPTRFEWPDDDLPPINLMDTSFEDISYTSKPLLTQEEEIRASTSFDDIRNSVNDQPKKSISKKSSGGAKEQKTVSSLSAVDEGEEEHNNIGQKRKGDQNATNASPKRLKKNKETTISIKSSNAAELDHTKIVSEILKKYPQLVKKNKNIRLKIMAGGNKTVSEDIHVPVKIPKLKAQEEPIIKAKQIKMPQRAKETQKFSEEGPWMCHKCTEAGETRQEFVLYYLYRKHMTDVHNEVFDIRLCKYCGRRCGKHNLMMYHLYTKHGLKPPASYNFPKCDQCPYIALSAQKLTQHKMQHDPNEMQCLDCKLAFTSQQTLTAHIQITGHFNKAGRSSYDCQYCTKKLQSAINLFSHIKNSHLKEARRDGIVSLDEMNDVEDMEQAEENVEEEEEEEGQEEYIVPEILPETGMQKDKVKIISNVKVPARSEQGSVDPQQQTIPLEPSSEAEALSNVASGIATSLGLVDIVVLDDNQQYILQQQENQSGQPEFILPELSSADHPFSGQVITTQHSTVLPQGMLQSTGTEVGSTDELVMVLTDHDYQDEQEGGTADNSNIVVLYSHPVDGQQGQFITSQGNLLVNSQTGMLEIRNGATIATTTANQMVVNNAADTPIESIEMIQREIESHTEMKQEPVYEEEAKQEVAHNNEEQAPVEEIVEPQQQPQEVTHNEEISAHPEDNQIQNETVEETSLTEENNEVVQENSTAVENQSVEPKEEENGHENDDNVDSGTNFEEPMEIDEIEPQTEPEDVPNKDQSLSSEPKEDVSVPTEQASDADEDKGTDVPPDTVAALDAASSYGSSETLIINDPTNLYVPDESVSENSAEQSTEDIEKDAPEPMEVDGKVKNSSDLGHEVEDDIEEKESEKNAEPQSEECKESRSEVENEQEKGNEAQEEVPEAHEHQVTQEDVSQLTSDQYQLQSETSNSQYNDDDENSQSSQDTAQSQENANRNQSNINQAILEDWEDTDSQQSEKQRVAMKEAAENVNKLMDDWEEEDDEDDKKEVEQ